MPVNCGPVHFGVAARRIRAPVVGSGNALSRIKDARGVEPLDRGTFHEQVPRPGLVEIAALREIGDPRTEDLLLDGVTNKQTRARAIEALGGLQSKRAVQPIIRALRDPDPLRPRLLQMHWRKSKTNVPCCRCADS